MTPFKAHWNSFWDFSMSGGQRLYWKTQLWVIEPRVRSGNFGLATFRSEQLSSHRRYGVSHRRWLIETKMSSFWRNFYHWLHWKLSFWQLPMQPVMKISSKWKHFRFSARLCWFNSLSNQQRKHQGCALLVRGIHRWMMDSHHKGPLMCSNSKLNFEQSM